jgi:hypothetical protein
MNHLKTCNLLAGASAVALACVGCSIVDEPHDPAPKTYLVLTRTDTTTVDGKAAAIVYVQAHGGDRLAVRVIGGQYVRTELDTPKTAGCVMVPRNEPVPFVVILSSSQAILMVDLMSPTAAAAGDVGADGGVDQTSPPTEICPGSVVRQATALVVTANVPLLGDASAKSTTDWDAGEEPDANDGQRD